MARTVFNFLLIDNKGLSQAGFDDWGTADKVAKTLGYRVEENVLCELKGNLRINTTDATLNGMGIGAAIAEVLDIRSTRGWVDIGYVRIVIKPAVPKEENIEDGKD